MCEMTFFIVQQAWLKSKPNTPQCEVRDTLLYMCEVAAVHFSPYRSFYFHLTKTEL